MALDPLPPVVLPFRSGVQTEDDPKQFGATGLEVLENAVFTSPGRIRKRYGNTRIGNAAIGSSPVTGGLFSFKDEVLGTNGLILKTYSPVGGWTERGPMVSCVPTQSAVSRSDTTVLGPDSAVYSTTTACYAWSEANAAGTGFDVLCTVIDRTTGATIAHRTVVAAAAGGYSNYYVKTVCLGSKFFIFFVNATNSEVGGTRSLVFYDVNATTGVVSTVHTVGDMEPGSTGYDVTVMGGRCYVAWRDLDANNGGNPAIATGYIDEGSTSVTAGGSLTYSDAAYEFARIGLFAKSGSDGLVVVYSARKAASDDSIGCNELDVGSGATSSTVCTQLFTLATTINRITGIDVSGGDTWLVCSDSSNVTRTYTFDPALGTHVVGAVWRGLPVVAKPFVFNSAVRFVLGYPSSSESTQPTLFVVDEAGNVMAKALSQEAGIPNAMVLPEVNVLTSERTIQWAAMIRSRLVPLSTSYTAETWSSVYGVNAVTLDFYRTPYPGSAHIGGNLLIAGGVLRAYDGAGARDTDANGDPLAVNELGFNYYPEGLTASSGTAGTTYSYNYVACYEWTDQTGALHRSSPSAALAVTQGDAITTAKGFTITIPTLILSSKGDGVRVALYRTANGGTTYYKVGSTANDTAASSVTISDETTDANLVGNLQLYTTGSVLANDAPPPCEILIAHKNRAFCVDSMTPLNVWYSKTVASGFPVEFSSFNVLSVEEDGGDVTALGSMDEKLVIFKRNRIYVVTGDGPNSLGTENDFSTAARIAADAGCVDHRSVVLTPAGLMFKSAKGFRLLDRSLQVQDVGGPVDSYNSATVKAAVLVEDETQVRFLAGSNVLVFDYGVGQWSVFTGMTAFDATIYDSVYVWMDASGYVLEETPNAYEDTNTSGTATFISMKAKTGWINVAALQGFQRLWRMLVLGDYHSAHRLNCRIEYDYDEYDYEDVSIAVTTASDTTIELGIGVDPITGYAFVTETPTTINRTQQPYQHEFRPAKQKCEAVRLTLYDSETTTKGQSMSLSALTLLVGAKRGAFKLPASKRLT